MVDILRLRDYTQICKELVVVRLDMNFSGVIKRLRESQGCSEISSFCTFESEYPSMPIPTAERQVSKPIENTEIEKNSKKTCSLETL